MPVVIMLILAGLALVTMLAREQASGGAAITGNTLRGEFKAPPGGALNSPRSVLPVIVTVDTLSAFTSRTNWS